MSKYLTLLKGDFYKLIKIENLFIKIWLDYLLIILSISFVFPPQSINLNAPLFIVAFMPIIVLSRITHLIKLEVENGTIEHLLTIASPIEIITSKLLAIFIIVTLSFSLAMPIFFLIFSISQNLVLPIYLTILHLCALSCSFSYLISIMESYFKNNSNLLTPMIIPLLLPFIILSGMAIKSSNLAFLWILSGVCIAVIPILIMLGSYLISNIYQISN